MTGDYVSEVLLVTGIVTLVTWIVTLAPVVLTLAPEPGLRLLFGAR